MNKSTEITGFFGVFIVGMLMMFAVKNIPIDPSLMQQLPQWIVHNVSTLRWIAAIGIFVATVGFPLISMLRSDEYLAKIGYAIHIALIVAAIPAIAFLLSAGWFAGQKLIN